MIRSSILPLGAPWLGVVLSLTFLGCDGGSSTDGPLGGGPGTGGDGTGGSGTATGGSGPDTGGSGPGTGGNESDEWGAGDDDEGSGGPATGFTECATLGGPASIADAWSTDDDAGPEDHDSKYGARPRLVAAPRGDGSFDFAWQADDSEVTLHVTHVEATDEGYEASWTVSAPSLGQIGGLAIADDGEPVVVTADLEAISGAVDPHELHRDDVIELVKIGGDCAETYREDLRTDFDANASRLPIYQPFQAGTSRLAIGGGTYLLHYAQMTEFDANVDSRHQIGRFLRGNVSDGALSQELGSISHSFDQRVRFDGTDFVALALGDASLRGIEVSRITTDGEKDDFTLFAVKGGESATGGGYNNTFTRLGDLRPSATGYVAVFVTEAGDVRTETVNVSRNVAWTHLPADFASGEQGEKYDVTVTDTETGNDAAVSYDVSILDYWDNAFDGHNSGIVWLTDYAEVTTLHAERPKVVRWGSDRFFVLWEKWSRTDFTETMVKVVDEWGHEILPATSLGSVRLPRGDDAFLLGGRAAWLTSTGGAVTLHTVDRELALTSFVL